MCVGARGNRPANSHFARYCEINMGGGSTPKKARSDGHFGGGSGFFWLFLAFFGFFWPFFPTWIWDVLDTPDSSLTPPIPFLVTAMIRQTLNWLGLGQKHVKIRIKSKEFHVQMEANYNRLVETY